MVRSVGLDEGDVEQTAVAIDKLKAEKLIDQRVLVLLDCAVVFNLCELDGHFFVQIIQELYR